MSPCVSPDPRLVEDLAARMGNITVLHKGCPDIISNGKVIYTIQTNKYVKLFTFMLFLFSSQWNGNGIVNLLHLQFAEDSKRLFWVD